MKSKSILWLGFICLGVLAFAWMCPAVSHPQKRQAQRIGESVNSFKPFPAFPR
jgi:hypothetical protein